MTHTELQKMTVGKFTKVAETENSIVVGTIGALTEEKTNYDVILHIAKYYNINTDPGIFQYHFTTTDGAKEKGCKFPVNNFNVFIEFFK